MKFVMVFAHICHFLHLQTDLFSLGGAKDVTWASRDAQPVHRQNGHLPGCSAHTELRVSSPLAVTLSNEASSLVHLRCYSSLFIVQVIITHYLVLTVL